MTNKKHYFKMMTEKSIATLLALKPYPQQNDYYQEADSWYSEVYESTICSRDRYRLLSILLGILLTICLLLCISLLPLKKEVYRLLEINTQTGEVTQLKELDENPFKANWAVTRYFIAQYVLNRNLYHYEDIKRTFNIALAMSNRSIADTYSNEIIDTNPESPINKLNKTHYREVEIIGINQLNANTALVRFKTITHNQSVSTDIKTEDFQVIVKWDYQNVKSSALDREKNPLGFTVTYYQSSPIFTNN